jgi:hypothetical protein
MLYAKKRKKKLFNVVTTLNSKYGIMWIQFLALCRAKSHLPSEGKVLHPKGIRVSSTELPVQCQRCDFHIVSKSNIHALLKFL